MHRHSRTLFALPLALLLLVAGCGQLPVRDTHRYNAGDAVQTARAALGAPYRYGGADPRGFDCSGLVYYSFRQAGIVTIPRSLEDQYAASTPVPEGQLQAGDLVFFRLDNPKISHVGIYIGNGQFIHAPSTGKQVSYAPLDSPYWQPRLAATRRF